MLKKVYGFLPQAFYFFRNYVDFEFYCRALPFQCLLQYWTCAVISCTLLKIIKLEQVESLGTALTSLIGFLFVPAGISVMNSLGVMQQYLAFKFV